MQLTYLDPFLASEFFGDDEYDMSLFLQGYMITNFDAEEARVLDDEDQDRINNLLVKRKSNVTRKAVLQLFLRTGEVPKEPILLVFLAMMKDF